MVQSRFSSTLTTGCLAIGLAIVTGCTSTNSPRQVQVVDRSAPQNVQVRQPTQPAQGQYIVKPGDTLYGIAFRFGWDWKALAARNQIVAPYTIKPGQKIYFGTGSFASRPTTTTPVTTQTATKAPLPVAAKPVQAAPASKPVVAQAQPSVQKTPTPAPTPAAAKSAAGWTWPTSGTVIGRFSSNASLNKGIDIAGNLGQPILAASNGTVVYAGSGLRGYGELVIIKHSDTYVSAYGHNRRLLVREGQQVKAGQAIAEMGSTGTDRVKLHFEIRKQGKPVDPLEYLPRR